MFLPLLATYKSSADTTLSVDGIADEQRIEVLEICTPPPMPTMVFPRRAELISVQRLVDNKLANVVAALIPRDSRRS